ncbi:Uncharacterised protein [Vibrio cholerae]|nr:Uncharacterised protein [Vibrio cholerae]
MVIALKNSKKITHILSLIDMRMNTRSIVLN